MRSHVANKCADDHVCKPYFSLSFILAYIQLTNMRKPERKPKETTRDSKNVNPGRQTNNSLASVPVGAMSEVSWKVRRICYGDLR